MPSGIQDVLSVLSGKLPDRGKPLKETALKRDMAGL
jgi:hypothetical protein